MVVQLHHIRSNGNHGLPERFERKYYLIPRDVGLACGLLRHICLTARMYPSEQINSLYFDTAGLEQHERSSSGDYQKDKVRIRWYGKQEDLRGMQTVFLELKSRRGFASTKQRYKLSVPAADLALERLHAGIIPESQLYEALAGFGYFPAEKLLPVIRISYWRYRFDEMMSGQRVSLDCHIRSTILLPGPGNGERELGLPGGVIEIKGTNMELPRILRRIRMLDLDWGRFSKYSACIDSHNERPGTAGRLSPSGRVVD